MADAARRARGLNTYVSSPYGDDLPEDVRAGRYDAAMHACGRLITDGVRAYSPIVHVHHMAMAGYKPPNGWYGYDLAMVGLFDMMLVLMIDGWDESRGVALEIVRMESFGKPVLYVTPAG